MVENLGWTHCCWLQGTKLNVPCMYAHKDIKWSNGVLDEPKKLQKIKVPYKQVASKRLVYPIKLCAWRIRKVSLCDQVICLANWEDLVTQSSCVFGKPKFIWN